MGPACVAAQLLSCLLSSRVPDYVLQVLGVRVVGPQRGLCGTVALGQREHCLLF